MNDAATNLVVAAVPVLGVEPGHVAEARRALEAQGRVVDDDAIERLLWCARALPVALDALATDAALRDVILGAPAIESVARTEQAALVAVARIEAGAVVVEILDARALFAAGDDDAVPALVVTIPFTRADAVDDVALHRFSLGPP